MDGQRAAVLARGARWGRDESKAYGVDGDATNARQRHVIDWLEQASDLPHLIARLSELVLSFGYEPEDLVILPRGELDRREMAAYSAGWADVVDEQLPAVRGAYEQRITAAYLQGQEDARTGRRPRRARRAEGDGERGGEVIPLPYVQLLRPPSELTRVEQRGERERSVADGTPWDGIVDEVEDIDEVEEEDEYDIDGGGADAGPGADTLLSAREVRGKRAVPAAAERRSVVRRNGRPSVPPLNRDGPGGGRDKGRRGDGGAGEREQQESADAPGRRLSDKARALADELEGRAPGRRRDE
ncbi:hypothetical protein ABZ372_15835 [Streptomyces sp. NPDC005921]|uniref:hypothetical protein n=1 Tax=unclassified Streptomyces TaxID=2593676 RepID=UPI0033F592BA